MKLLSTVTLVIAFAGSAFAQINYPLASVREDFHEASIVARVNVTDTKLGGCDDYACEYTVIANVTHVYKGRVRRGQLLKFGARSDKEYDYNKIRGDRIAFLTSFVNRRKGPFQILPDGFSLYKYSPGLIAKVRRVTYDARRVHRRR